MNIFLQILIGFILADIVSGIFHWFEDTYFDYCIDIPILSEIARDNEMHHYFPRGMISYSYLEHMQVTIPIGIFSTLVLYITNKSFVLKYPYLVTTLVFFSVIANIIHRFSHMRECENNSVVVFLQKTGIFSSHSHHSLHHTEIDTKYCIISEYNNYLLDSIYFWRILEYIIYLFTNVKPNRKQSYEDYYMIQNHMHKDAKLECPDKPTKKDMEYLKTKLRMYKKCKL
jgi:ubiquitin-conjugating enzyme E2 variant